MMDLKFISSVRTFCLLGADNYFQTTPVDIFKIGSKRVYFGIPYFRKRKFRPHFNNPSPIGRYISCSMNSRETFFTYTL